MMPPMKAVVMAGGQGTRLRPLTSNLPKPMLPIVGQPMMQHILRLAQAHGFIDVVATVQFLASIVRNHFGDGSELGLSLRYVTEGVPLGTAGSVKNAESELDDRFLVLSGDSLTDVDLSELVRFHRERGAAVTVTLRRVDDPLEFGIVVTGEDGRIERFLEKPGWGDVFSDTINTGIYVIEREVLEHIPHAEEFDFAKDLFPRLLREGLPLYGYVTDRYWTDVGTLEAYIGGNMAVLDHHVEVQIDGFEIRDGVWLGEGAEVDPDAVLEPPVYIGAKSRVEGGATLGHYTVLGDDVTVKSGASLHRAIVHDHAYVGTAATLRGCVIGSNSDLKFGVGVEEGAVVANDSHIGNGAILLPQVKVYPFKSVEPGAIVSRSIVWQSGGPRGLFGERGVSGLINVDVTPETAMRLAMAYASTLPRDATVVTCRDLSRAARVFKRAMLVGLNAGGIDCHDLELVPVPVARFYGRSERAAGGFAVRTAPLDPASIEIQFFDDRGNDIAPSAQRRLERAFHRDDLRRAFYHDIGELSFPARAREYYVRALLDSVDLELLRARRVKLVVDYACGAAALTGPSVLGRVGADILAVNAVLDEDRVLVRAEDRDRSLRELARTVGASGAEIGVMLDATGERLVVVDGSGRIIHPEQALAAFVWLVGRVVPAPRVALPLSASRTVQAIVEARGGAVTWTRKSPSALMAAADTPETDFAGDTDGGYIFPSFLPAYDSLMSLLKLLELLARCNTSLERVVDGLPPAHVARRDVATPWEAKGAVMRLLLERLNGRRLVTMDGVKVYRAEDWALVIPHPVEPVIGVWAESGTAEEADALVEEFAALVRELRG
jgi:mannose-1-phosphate guanylyltransferase/phosphomannomutase